MKRLLHKYSNQKKITKKSQGTFEIKVPTMFLNTWSFLKLKRYIFNIIKCLK